MATSLILLLACTAPELVGMETGPEHQESLVDTGERPRQVVIIGGGPSGLMTALTLGEGTLLEASPALGGRSVGPGHSLYFGDGLDWEERTGAPPTAGTEAWLERLPSLRVELEEIGVRFSPDQDVGLYRTENALDALVRVHIDGVEIRVDTPALDILFEGGRVWGVQLADEVLEATDVVIATGGFVNRAEAVARFVSWPEGTWTHGPDAFAQGQALDWADLHGWGLACAECVGAFADGWGVPGEDGLALLREQRPVPWIVVDAQGQRLADETWRGMRLSGLAHRAGPSWAITTRVAMEHQQEGAPDEVLAALVCEDEVDTLALTLGTVRDLRPEELDPVGRAGATMPDWSDPPCALPVGRISSKNFGGLAVDLDGRVLDRDGAVVPGLWAVGEAAGMGVPGMGGAWGFDGSLSAVVWSGERTAEAILGQ